MKQSFNLFFIPLILFVAAFWTVFAVWLLSDEPLNPEIEVIVQDLEAEVTTRKNGTVFLLGLSSFGYGDVYKYGMKRVQDYENWIEEQHLDAAAYYEEGLPEHAGDDVFSIESDWLCEVESITCMESVWQNTEALEPLLKSNVKLLALIDQLQSFEYFRLASTPGMFMPIPNSYIDLSVAQLYALQSLLHIKKNDTQQAISLLADLVDMNRRMLDSPYIITKVIAAATQKMTLHIAAFALKETPAKHLPFWSEFADSLVPYSKGSLSLERQMNLELAMMVNQLVAFKSGLLVQEEGWADTLMQRVLFKPNQTLNDFHDVLLSQTNKYQWQGDAILHMPQKSLPERGVMAKLKNFKGDLLVDTMSPRFLDIEDTLLELEFQQRVLVAQINFRITQGENAEIRQIVSPYTGKVGTKTEAQICFDDNKSAPKLCYYDK